MEENTTIKSKKNIEIMLENKLELGEFMNILILILGEIFGTDKCDLCKFRFPGVFLAVKTPLNFLRWRFAHEF